MCSNVWTSLALPPSFQRSFWTPSCFSPVSSKARPTGTQRRHSCVPLFNALCNRQTFWERARIKKTCLKRFCWGRFLSCSLLHHPPPPPLQDSCPPFNSMEYKEQFPESGFVHCTSTGSGGAMCLAACRPQVSFNCVSNWLLPMQLLPMSHSIFHRSRKGPGGTSCAEGQHSYRHIWAPNVAREEAHVKLKAGASHQWRLALIDCCVMPLWSRDGENFRADCCGLRPRGIRTRLHFSFSSSEVGIILRLPGEFLTVVFFSGYLWPVLVTLPSDSHCQLNYFSFRPGQNIPHSMSLKVQCGFWIS